MRSWGTSHLDLSAGRLREDADAVSRRVRARRWQLRATGCTCLRCSISLIASKRVPPFIAVCSSNQASGRKSSRTNPELASLRDQ